MKETRAARLPSNEGDLAIGKEAALVAADFSVEGDPVKLIGVEEQR
jgi:hypothetical protein